MNSSTFRQPLPEEQRRIAATGHDKSGNAVNGAFTFTPQLAAGGIYTTATDYARFMIACRKAWLGLSNPLIGPELGREMMVRTGGGQFALGWEIFGGGAHQRFAHGGSNEGYQCNATCLLEQGAGAVVLTNGLMGILQHPEVINAIADAFSCQGYLKPPRRVREVPPDQQQRIAGRYLIMSGVSAPHLDIWIENGQLHSFVEGLILPPRPIYLDEGGRFFTQQTPSETELEFGPDGEVAALTVFAEGDVELIRAVRQR
jgi:CubicO group peptidase (beta-lactamase class C family)